MEITKNKKRKSFKDKSYSLVLRVGDVFFPSVNEVQFVIGVVIVGMMTILEPSLISKFVELLAEDLRSLIFPVVALVLAGLMISNRSLSENTKLLACAFYYGIFAALALIALGNLVPVGQNASIYTELNYWITRIFLVVTLARGILAFIILRLGYDRLSVVVTQNFHTAQYRKLTFVYTFVITVALSVIISKHYDNLATVAVLVFGYTNIFLSFMKYFFKPHIIHK